ncbi:MAG TPA: hypothetical protein VFY93_13035 [Planctomycetota bacterium]|nr:hypothetical protein [Planctomycetota bacterium]
MRLGAIALLLLAAGAVAGEGARLDDGQRAALVSLVGETAWSGMPPWRQRLVLDRYARFLDAPAGKREAVERAGLRAWLLQTPEDPHVPPPLAGAIERLPPQMRPLAEQFAAVRLRQLRLDRGLLHLPFEERRAMFHRLFPEPFVQETAREAYEELRRREARHFAHMIKEELSERDVPREERREMARRVLAAEEERLMERVRGELDRLAGANPERARRFVERFLAAEQENLRFVTPRQRELVRYAIRPEECPLIDPLFLGPPPEDPAERRVFENDFRVLARLDLLAEAGFPREMVLHLAGAISPEDFLRAVQSLSRPPGPPPPPGPR